MTAPRLGLERVSVNVTPPSTSPPSAWRLDLLGDAEAPRQARRLLRVLLQEWGVPPLVVDDALLIVTELVTNSVLHAAPPAHLEAVKSACDLRLSVSDASPVTPATRKAGPDGENGRGLVLVDALAGAWGSRATGSGKTVWAELPLAARP